jgi:hypothetical protein
MQASRFDTITKAAATGVTRRQVLRGLLATTGGGTLIHLTGDESDARLSRCCQRKKREAKQDCFNFTEGNCPKLIDFSCVKTGRRTCETVAFGCTTKDGVRCVA